MIGCGGSCLIPNWKELMVAYSFKARFAEPILTNQKLQTIRLEGKRRHVGAGSTLQLYTGMRTKQCRLVATRRCASVHQIELMIFPSVQKIAARVDGRALNERETILLARMDGFDSVADMWQFWRNNHKGVERFNGLLIKWEPNHGG